MTKKNISKLFTVGKAGRGDAKPFVAPSLIESLRALRAAERVNLGNHASASRIGQLCETRKKQLN